MFFKFYRTVLGADNNRSGAFSGTKEHSNWRVYESSLLEKRNRRQKNRSSQTLHQEEQTAGDEENPRCLLLNALQECAGERVSVALLRTAALHLYTWRASGSSGDGIFPTAAAVSAVPHKAADERQAEMLLVRAVKLEPFHVPTMTALAFVLLQRSGGSGEGGRAVASAEGLLEKAVECAGRRGACEGTEHGEASFGDGKIQSNCSDSAPSCVRSM